MANKTIKFHIHLPGGIGNIGQLIVLGDREELRFWQKPIVNYDNHFNLYFILFVLEKFGNNPEDDRMLDIKRYNSIIRINISN
ncbi:hypothetical protein RhiirA4_481486 [Rhizophagus irregularis]|uniref:Uncharacterized protein n=1 Tax=Rhizophagus irregularis TaxID=588596 RepID=A0A2I1HJM7_9GLOM|nr:hypothetical protein RhiirA4_481486 [Rhizophagus irregularis]